MAKPSSAVPTRPSEPVAENEAAHFISDRAARSRKQAWQWATSLVTRHLGGQRHSRPASEHLPGELVSGRGDLLATPQAARVSRATGYGRWRHRHGDSPATVLQHLDVAANRLSTSRHADIGCEDQPGMSPPFDGHPASGSAAAVSVEQGWPLAALPRRAPRRCASSEW